MKCFIVSRATLRLRSHELAARLGYDYFVVVDDTDQADRAVSQPFNVPHSRVVVVDSSAGPVPGPPCGAAFKRDWVARTIMPVGEWSVWLDDNVECLTGLCPGLSQDVIDLNTPPPGSTWRAEFARVLTHKWIHHYVGKSIDRAEQAGTIMVGFSTQNNFYFRSRKWQDFGYCRTQFVAYKNDGSTWFPFPTMMFEDAYKTVDVVARYGQVVVNRHMKPVKPMFEAGGIGAFDERLPHLQENCRRIVEMFPGLVRAGGDGAVYGRPGVTDFHLEFALRGHGTIERWRRQHGYLQE